ncbi:MAG: phosphoglucosamine mutase, partial [Actinomycetota bacterium]
MGRLFGTDGIRGVAGHDLTAELAISVGRAAVAALGVGERPAFVVGRDTRASGEWLERALAGGIGAGGGEVLSVGVMPTPGVAFLTIDLGADAGIVISASHNPPGDNGLKFFSAEGRKLPDETEGEIERLVGRWKPDAGSAGAPSGAGSAASAIRAVEDAEERYLKHLGSAALVPLDGLRVVVDAANGAAHRLAPEAIRRAGAVVTAINTESDGAN